MEADQRAKDLKNAALALRIAAVLSFVLLPGFIGMLFDVSFFWEDTVVNHLTRWNPNSLVYEGMITVIYAVWGVFLLIAAKHPERYLFFINFSIWVTFAHATEMALFAIFGGADMPHMVSDVPMIYIGGFLLVWAYYLIKRANVTANA